VAPCALCAVGDHERCANEVLEPDGWHCCCDSLDRVEDDE